MRLSVLVLFLSPVSPIFAQSNPSIPFTAPPNSSPWSMQERDFSKLPPNFRFMPGLALPRPQSILALPQVPQPTPHVGMQLDPQIVVHPPQLRLGRYRREHRWRKICIQALCFSRSITNAAGRRLRSSRRCGPI
jgi:hypothetical protein